MKFMMLVKHPEKLGPPPQALMDAIDKLSEEAVKSGTMLGSGGLAPTAQGTRVRVSGERSPPSSPTLSSRATTEPSAICVHCTLLEIITWPS